jgi:putative glycosyl hydrolase
VVVALPPGLRRLGLLAALTALVAIGVAAPAAAAKRSYLVGFSEQQPSMFTNPLFQALGVRKARYIASWNVINSSTELRELETWLFAARLTGVTPLIAFNHSRKCFGRSCKLPGVSQYREAFRRFHKRFPWVREYSVWNEVNHFSQPTYRRPQTAARYYNSVRSVCPGCKVVAADVLDQGDAAWYLRHFLKFAKGHPRIWGLHNYSDTNRFRSRGTQRILKLVKGEIWLTETGGVVHFGRAFPFSPRRAAKATSYMFRLARSNPRIKRLYIYQWTGAKRNARFDAGLIDPHGKPRPAYYVVRRTIAPKRRPKPALPPVAVTAPTDQGGGVLPSSGQ